MINNNKSHKNPVYMLLRTWILDSDWPWYVMVSIATARSRGSTSVCDCRYSDVFRMKQDIRRSLGFSKMEADFPCPGVSVVTTRVQTKPCVWNTCTALTGSLSEFVLMVSEFTPPKKIPEEKSQIFLGIKQSDVWDRSPESDVKEGLFKAAVTYARTGN